MLKKDTANQNNNQDVMISQMLDHLYIARTISQEVYRDETIEAIFGLLADRIQKNIRTTDL